MRPKIADRILSLVARFGEPVWDEIDGDYNLGGPFIGRMLGAKEVRDTFPGPAVDSGLLDLVEEGYLKFVYYEVDGELRAFRRGPHSDAPRGLMLGRFDLERLGYGDRIENDLPG